MDTMQAIFGRRSYRSGFSDAPVPRADLREIMEAGLAAPSGHNLQTTQLIGVDDPALLKALGETWPHSGMTTAKAIVFVLARHEPSDIGACYDTEDFAAAAENMLLAIHAKGYASVWLQEVIQGAPVLAMKRILGVPDELALALCLPIGVPVKPLKNVPKQPFEDRAWFNGYRK